MKIKFIGTGSSGNAIVIQFEGGAVMIDCGIPKTKIEQRLIEHEVRPDSIDAIFLTHAHKDHVQGLPMAVKWGIPVFATEGTFKRIDTSQLEWCNIYDSPFITHHNFTASFFQTHHNDYDSCGYVIENDDYKVSVCLDTGHVSPDMIEAMQGSTHIIIEANHDRDMVTLSNYPDIVKERNMSDIGHLSNEQAAAAVAQIVQGHGERIYLAHLSNKCNKPYMALEAVKKAMYELGHDDGIDYFVEVV